MKWKICQEWAAHARTRPVPTRNFSRPTLHIHAVNRYQNPPRNIIRKFKNCTLKWFLHANTIPHTKTLPSTVYQNSQHHPTEHHSALQKESVRRTHATITSSVSQVITSKTVRFPSKCSTVQSCSIHCMLSPWRWFIFWIGTISKRWEVLNRIKRKRRRHQQKIK